MYLGPGIHDTTFNDGAENLLIGWLRDILAWTLGLCTLDLGSMILRPTMKKVVVCIRLA